MTVVLVEGLSDGVAIEAAAERCGLDLRRLGVDVVPMGGATNVGHFVERHRRNGGDARLTALCDAGEASLFARALDRFFVCDQDLEDELIRALGLERVEAIIEGEGDLGSLRTLQQMPFHRGRSRAEQLHRFMGVRSGRKRRYAQVLAAALDEDTLPPPICDLLTFVARRPE